MPLAWVRTDFETDVLPSGITVARTGAAATRYRSLDGVEEAIAANLPRFLYGRTTPFTRKGLMVEGPRTNSLQRSLDFTNAYWTFAAGTGATRTLTTGYDGTNTACIVTEGTGAAGNGFSKASGLGIVYPSAYCASVRIKAGGRRYWELTLICTGSQHRMYCDTLTPTTARNGAQFPGGHGVLDEGDGWLRFWGSATAGDTVNQIYITPRDGMNSNAATAVNTQQTILQRPQLEEGLFPSSTLGTAGATVTRGLETLSIVTPPIAAANSHVLVLDYTLLTGASAGGPLLYEQGNATTVPVGSTGRTAIRFNAVASTIDYLHLNGSIQSVGSYDPGNQSVLIGSDGDSLAGNIAIHKGVWLDGLATDGELAQASTGFEFKGGTDLHGVRSPVRSSVRSPVRSPVS